MFDKFNPTFFSRLLLLACLLTASVSRCLATNYYVLAGGAGTHDGTSWTNANCRIPTLAAGDVVYIGNSGGNLADTTTACAGEASHTFSTSGTSGSHITIRAATGADHGTATGWSSAFGVDVTPEITWSNSFQPADGLKSPFWAFCPGSYYDIDGKVGTTDQTGTYGFYFRSAGIMFGFIKADSHDCSEANISNLTFANLEFDGVEANGTLNNTQPGGTGLYIGSPVSATATVQSVSLSTVYIHDLFTPISSAGNVTGLTFTNAYVYTNFSSTLEHSNAIDTQTAAGGTVGLNNLTVNSSVFKNIQGTGFIVCLNGACDGWKIYNNVFYYSSDWDSICEHGISTATCGVSKLLGDNTPTGVLTNSVIYGNTIANVHIKPGHAGADEAGVVVQVSGSGSNTVQNTFWYNCTAGDIFQDTKVSHDYNTWSSTNTTATTLAAHEFSNGMQPNPFINEYGNFRLVSATVNPHLSDGNSLSPPYNIDFVSNLRNSSSWTRGAYQFSIGIKPNPPTSLTTTVR